MKERLGFFCLGLVIGCSLMLIFREGKMSLFSSTKTEKVFASQTEKKVPSLPSWTGHLEPMRISGTIPVVQTDLFDQSGEFFAFPDYGIKAAVAVGLVDTDSTWLARIHKSMCTFQPHPPDDPLNVPRSGCIVYDDSEGTPRDQCVAFFWDQTSGGWACGARSLSERVFIVSGDFFRVNSEFIDILKTQYSLK